MRKALGCTYLVIARAITCYGRLVRIYPIQFAIVPHLAERARQAGGVGQYGRVSVYATLSLVGGPPEYPLTRWGGPLGGVSSRHPSRLCAGLHDQLEQTIDAFICVTGVL